MSHYSHLAVDLENDNSAPTKIVRLVGSGRLVLDVGCAHGHLAEALRARGCRVVGVEQDPEDAARARTHCEQVLDCDLEQPGWTAPLTGRRFDVIVFADVLEHLRDPARVLREACQLLAPGTGMVVASIPNVAHVSVRLELLLGSFRREALGILDETHLRFFTRDTVHELFASCGLAIDSWDYTTNDIADQVVADYLAQAGITYTAELRARFRDVDAAAYQFIVTACPAAAVTAGPAPVPKPLETMHETREALEELQRGLRQVRTSAAELWAPREGGLRVLQVVHQFLPRHAAGTEIYCADLSFALVRRGHAVRVLSGAPFRDDAGVSTLWEGDQGIGIEKIAATRPYRVLGPVRGFFDRFDNPQARVAIGEMLDMLRPDVIHIQHLLYLSAQLFSEARNRGIPVVVTLHDYWFLCHRVKLRRRDGELCDGPEGGWRCAQCLNLPRLARSPLNPLALGANLYRYAYLTRQLGKASRILAPSRYLREVFVRNGIPPDRIVHCEAGTAPPPPDMAALFGAPRREGPLRVGYLGTFIRDKGVDVLIDAVNELPPDAAELHIFGIPVEPGYVEELKARARHPGIRWRGPVAHSDRWRALAEIDVLVVPSIWYENSPLAIHEAHVAGVPVIGSAAGGIPEFVRDGVDGRTFPLGDARALAACLREVVASPERLAAWRAAIVPPKSMDAHVDEIEALYREVRGVRTREAAR